MSKLVKSKAVNAPFKFNENVMFMTNYIIVIITIIILYENNQKQINSFFDKEVSEIFSPIENASKSNSDGKTKPKHKQSNNNNNQIE